MFKGYMQTGWQIYMNLDMLRGSVEIEGLLVRDSPGTLHYVLEQDTILCLVLVQRRNMGNCPNITEKLLTGT